MSDSAFGPDIGQVVAPATDAPPADRRTLARGGRNKTADGYWLYSNSNP